jgi:hypothetical protein
MSINTEKTPLPMLLKRNRLFLIVGVLLLAYGLWMNIQWFSAKPSVTIYLVNLLPGTSLLFAWYLASQNVEKRWEIIVLGIFITAIISFFAIYMNIAAGIVLAATTPDSDAADYLEVREQIGNSELIRHFPPTVPDNATNVKFVYFGGFMQGGAYIQLRLQLPQDEIVKRSEEYHSRAKYKFIGGSWTDHVNAPNGVPTTHFHTGETEDGSFPNNYEILVLNAQPEGTSDFQWNHGYSYGVVISLENSEIIYWAEDW